ncbi:type VI secretion system baseplate subunit TssF [Crenothrix polyspora]|uniref:Type VI secretion protein, VC_A0110 family n=1 Tax=Crenothrix polyspora TaxID=360316 RepID=A0A1R4HA40_9GAMM|nr:type VI secretion system baseplate subunit TssF [Crenothrix polyspora]SJM93115.1 Type VI secretion protein, VC_A0110 family [Crenothrix polyspora]
MNPRFLDHYQRELQFIREMGKEFAQLHPDIAGRLDLGDISCDDPYVERLLESFAFLTARIQLKMEAEFPDFTQNLLQMVYPHYLAPLPSMTVVQIKPDLQGGVSEQGFVVPKHTRLFSYAGIKGRAKCEFRTADEVALWPLQITEANYLPLGAALRYAGADNRNVKAALRLRLDTVLDLPLQQLSLNKLPIYLHGIGSLPTQLYELIFGHAIAVVVQPPEQTPAWRETLTHAIQALGFQPQQALLPYTPPSFHGYRLLQEYFSLPQRFMFFQLVGLQAVLKRCTGTSLEVVILLDTAKPELEDLVKQDNFVLYCTPAINLLEKRADRIHLNHRSTEYQVIVDNTAQSDYEVHTITEVAGYRTGSAVEQIFHPFYSMRQAANNDSFAYYTVQRQPSIAGISSTDKLKESYLGHEVFVSLVDSSNTPYRSDLKQLGVTALCTNRDLPMLLVLGEGHTDFTLEISAPVVSVRCLVKPSNPKTSKAEGEYAWRLISHLSLNYLSVIDNDAKQGAVALRELLRLYGDFAEATIAKQIEGVVAVESRSATMRIPIPGPMCFGRGLEITVTLDESAFSGNSGFLLGALLEKFFCKYVSINSFTQVLIKSRERGEIMRWPVRTGTRDLV